MPDARAPYNFVRLPKKILPAPLAGKEYISDPANMSEKELQAKYTSYIKAEGKYSGCIELEIRTLTPCFIGGNESEFFGPTGKPIIPGSTLRGMTKNIFKIITCGAMRKGEDFDDTQLYFRGVGMGGSLSQHYTEQLGVGHERDEAGEMYTFSEAQPGYIVSYKKNGPYYIYPSRYEGDYKRQYRIKDASRENTIEQNRSLGGWTCYTGKMGKKTHNFVVPESDWDRTERLEVPQKVVEAYLADVNRAGVDILASGVNSHAAQAPEAETVITYANQQAGEHFAWAYPCFYHLDEQQVVESFGFGMLYRIPYKTSIGEHIPAALQGSTIDFADAVFGRVEAQSEEGRMEDGGRSFWASRVFFEDGKLQAGERTLEEEFTHPLSSPNPTSFQLYLEQAGNDPKKAAFWDSEREGKPVPIRGYKLYWHKAADWKIDTSYDARTKNHQKETPLEGAKPIRPLAAGAVFHSRIRFCSLSRIELGALLRVFDLAVQDGELCYKIGQGKSLGLGSVRIVPTLRLDSATRFKTLFAGGRWAEATQRIDPGTKPYEEFLQAFDDYQRTHIKEGAYQVAQRELATLLDWKNTEQPGWAAKTQAMNINEKLGKTNIFASRIILPTATEVTKS